MIYAISGKIRSGKDTTGQILARYLDIIAKINKEDGIAIIYDSEHNNLEKVEYESKLSAYTLPSIAKFSNLLKRVCEMYAGPNSDAFSEKGKEQRLFNSTYTMRKFQQDVGTILRKVKSDIHVWGLRNNLLLNTELVCSKINGNTILIKAHGTYVITDLRTMEELKFCEDIGAITIRVERGFKYNFISRLKSWFNRYIYCYDYLYNEYETYLDGKLKEFDFIIQNTGTILDLHHKILDILLEILKTSDIIFSKERLLEIYKKNYGTE